MGYRSIAPQHSLGFWNAGALGSFQVGPVLDRWLQAAPSNERTRLGESVGAEGHVRVATRVRRLIDGRFRYDYAVMNFDFSRAVTDPGTSEPNLRILRNLGLGSIEIPLLNGASVDASEFRDGDAEGANDWPGGVDGAAWRWVAPNGATQDWGSLLFVRIESPSAPANGHLRLDIAEPGSPAFLQVVALVPDAAQVFSDSFE
jgi:hypothetical protein